MRRLKELIGDRVLIAVIKADAYGHGAYPVARSAIVAGADLLGVVHVNEALELRADGIDAPLMAWLHTPPPILRLHCRRKSAWVFLVGTWRR